LINIDSFTNQRPAGTPGKAHAHGWETLI